MGSDTKQGRQRSRRGGYKRTRRPKRQNGSLVSLVRLRAGKRPPYLPPLKSAPATLPPAGELSAQSERLLRLPHVLRLVSEWLRARLSWSSTTRLMAYALLLPALGCSTPPGQTTKENPFLAIPPQLLREPLQPLPLSPHLRAPSTTTPKTQQDAPKTAASSQA